MSSEKVKHTDTSTPYYLVHKAACEKGGLTYEDPETGYTVFTELSHLKRGKCCGNKCRHCPFDHVNVRENKSKTFKVEIELEKSNSNK
ncbi:hypothetical protein HK099_007455 [Clydaea vesicula]|uniref:Uncharacterized protein n=1 Tax=Clydaea vesicula TaxID=447962 RepID=A0AAD5TYM3_9FUNG|nr:hypothetical protein HK099_007455 [Clydaea vesicula]